MCISLRDSSEMGEFMSYGCLARELNHMNQLRLCVPRCLGDPVQKQSMDHMKKVERRCASLAYGYGQRGRSKGAHEISRNV